MKIEKKISRLSRFFRFLAVIEMVRVLGNGIFYWIKAPYLIPALPEMNMMFVSDSLRSQIPSLGEMSSSLKAVGVLAFFAPIIAKALICLFLTILFTQYKKRRFFSEKALKSIRNIGYAILGGALFSLLCSFITYYLLPPDFPIMGRGLQGIMIYAPAGYSMSFVVGGLFIIFISWIMSVGKQLEDEQRYTV